MDNRFPCNSGTYRTFCRMMSFHSFPACMWTCTRPWLTPWMALLLPRTMGISFARVENCWNQFRFEHMVRDAPESIIHELWCNLWFVVCDCAQNTWTVRIILSEAGSSAFVIFAMVAGVGAVGLVVLAAFASCSFFSFRHLLVSCPIILQWLQYFFDLSSWFHLPFPFPLLAALLNFAKKRWPPFPTHELDTVHHE
jgi:hypothetical protein